MSTILTIETSTQACSVALSVDGVAEQEISLEPRSHTRLLLPLIDKLLAKAAITPAQLTAIAYTAGPGSFTGLRIGFGVVQGLAFGCDLPVIGVSTLQTLVVGAQRQQALTAGDVVVPAFDARMGEVYWGAYRLADCHSKTGLPETVIADSLTTPDRVAEEVDGNNCIGVGEGFHLQAQFPVKPRQIFENLYPQAIDIVPLAEFAWQQGEAVAIDKAELTYLRDTVSWKKRQRLRTS